MQDGYEKYTDKQLGIISNNIRKFREDKGYSQEALAEKVECSREFLNRVENKKEDVSLKMLIRLAFVLEVSPKDFFN